MALPSTSNRMRVVWLLVVFGALLGALLLRLGYWQVVRAGWLQSNALDQWTRELPITAKRGDILDRRGNVLASSAPCFSVVVRPQEIKKAADQAAGNGDTGYTQQIVRDLSLVLGLDQTIVAQRVGDITKSEIRLKRQISNEETEQIQEFKRVDKDAGKVDQLKGVYLVNDKRRYYPMSDFLSQVLGFTSADGDGQEGLEAKLNKYLKGTDGFEVIEADGKGREIDSSVNQYVAPVDGYSVKLTIDSTVQNFLENAAEACMTKENPKKVTAIAISPSTGEILGMTVKPSFDNNAPPKDNITLLREFSRNTAISDAYEPGSTFKIITTAAALEEGTITAQSTFNCPGYRMVDGQKIKCWSARPHGHQTLVEGVENSCNPVFMDMALGMGKQTFYQWIYNFGFGSTTGIEMLGESSGIVTQEKYVRDLDLARIGFGQSIAVTPIQLISGVAAVINGGSLIKPSIVKEITDSQGNVIVNNTPQVVRQVISEKTSAAMRSILRSVVDNGSGHNAQIAGYAVGGKTGTAQKYGPDGRIMPNKNISSFIGFAPADNPKILVLFIVDEPNSGSTFGSVVAAPYAKDILEKSLKYMNVPPAHTENDPVVDPVEVPDLVHKELAQAEALLEGKGLHCKTEGYAGEVTDQFPAPGAKIAKGDTVTVFLKQVDDSDTDGKVVLPDLSAMTPLVVRDTLDELGLKLRVKGEGGKVKSQVPLPESEMYPGETVTVEFEYNTPAQDAGATP